jgi:hypothetical protein
VLMQSLPLFVSPWQKFCCKFLPPTITYDIRELEIRKAGERTTSWV